MMQCAKISPNPKDFSSATKWSLVVGAGLVKSEIQKRKKRLISLTH